MTSSAPIPNLAKRNLVLVADVGGTNTRIALANKSIVLEESARRYKNCAFEHLDAIIKKYLAESGQPVPNGACIAVAGPVIDNRVKLTNISWEVNAAQLSSEFGGIRVSVINDLQAVGYALHQLQPNELQNLIVAPEHLADSSQLVINAGTGFNAVAVHNIANKYFAAPSECGHTALPIVNDELNLLRQHIESRYGFASIEDVLSGRGSKLVREWIENNLDDREDQLHDQIIEAKYHNILASLLGIAARDLALTHLPFGGIFLTGGLIRGIAPKLMDSGFANAFHSAGRFSNFMKQFPVNVIIDDLSSLRGCASGFQYL